MTPTQRPSIDTNLLQRYTSQQAGGAFNAKSILKWGDHASLDLAAPGSLQSRFWTLPGFRVRMALTEFNRPGGSVFLKGHTAQKYTGVR